MSRRLFVAVEPSAGCRDLLHRARAALSERFPDLHARWQPSEDLHLTLAFLGIVDEARVDGCGAHVQRVAAAHRAFTLSTTRLGAFPSPSRPSVLWLGVSTEPPDALMDLQRDVSDALRDLHDDRRPFRPHLTLARVKGLGSTDRRELAETLAHLPSEHTSWTVEQVVLFESRLRPEGAVHAAVRIGTLAA